MTDHAPEGRSPRDRGATTGVKGTPFPVDVSADRRARVNLWLFVAGPVIWFAHFMLVYLVAEAGCTGEGPGLDVFDGAVPQVVSVAATPIAVVACMLVASASWRRWRAATQHARATGSAATETSNDSGRGPLAFTGLLLALLSTVAIVWVGLPVAVLPSC